SAARERPLLPLLSERSTACAGRSEEHTSELQSRLVISYAVFCLKKKRGLKIFFAYLFNQDSQLRSNRHLNNKIAQPTALHASANKEILLFFFNDTATTEIYTTRHTLSLHDALPISARTALFNWLFARHNDGAFVLRSEEHTSELQSRLVISYAVVCLKKKKISTTTETEYSFQLAQSALSFATLL